MAEFFVKPGVSAYGYGCTGHDTVDCETIYAFDDRLRLIGFFTTSRLFTTAAGTHVGSRLAEVLKSEHHLSWTGYAVQCVSVVFTYSKSVSFRAGVDYTGIFSHPTNPRVSYLSVAYNQSVSDGC
jgi:hypothetical protein